MQQAYLLATVEERSPDSQGSAHLHLAVRNLRDEAVAQRICARACDDGARADLRRGVSGFGFMDIHLSLHFHLASLFIVGQYCADELDTLGRAEIRRADACGFRLVLSCFRYAWLSIYISITATSPRPSGLRRGRAWMSTWRDGVLSFGRSVGRSFDRFPHCLETSAFSEARCLG